MSRQFRMHPRLPVWSAQQPVGFRVAGDLLLRGDSTLDPDIRQAAYGKALALIAERAYVLPLYSLPNYYVADKGLVFSPPPDEIPRFYEMSWK